MNEIKQFHEMSQEEKENLKHKIIENIKKYKAKNFLLDYDIDLISNAINTNKIPITAKDNIVTQHLRTTAGSRILDGFNTNCYDATIVKQLDQFIIFGKTNMDEFGFGTFGINSGFNAVKNAWEDELVAGGSSSGSGVAAQVLPFPQIAESTGGSITAPATFNGVLGFTPSYGAISRFGLISYANSLDKIGFIGRSFADFEIVFRKTLIKDKFDPTHVPERVIKNDNKRLDQNKVVIVEEMLDADEKIKDKFYSFLEKNDIQYEIISMPILKYALPTYYIISSAEASTNLAKYSGLRYGKIKNPFNKDYNEYFKEIRTKFFGEEAKRRMIIGTFVRMQGLRDRFYWKAQQIRQLIINDFKKVFQKYDLIALPSMPILPPTIKDAKKLSPLETYMIDKLTIPPNLAGLPHLNFPIEKHIGITFVANQFYDLPLLRFGNELSRNNKIRFVEEYGLW